MQAKRWFKTNYEQYPIGIKGFGKRKEDDSITIKLSDPVDIRILSKILKEEEYVVELTKAKNGHSILSFYSVYSHGETAEEKMLEGVFHEEQQVPLGPNPIHEGSANSRTKYLKKYLERKYS
ncbi:hypothetical protein NGM10_05010 [Halorussus salilacus]|uniref:hypothetical protein n=1 Tax=Halorussus salilacus TaxID=2953750 RepID=UPI0020A18851|nr:hypothetical protein [Halorussus salilacus]USZ69099.1 hypothetical protein NGM10_05010 [Halorussus salilacus]